MPLGFRKKSELDKRDRKIFSLWKSGKMTQAELAEDFSLSKERVNKIIAKEKKNKGR